MRILIAAALAALAAAAPAVAAERLLVVELFTSQGCSSCPPADALLGELGRADATLLPLDMHVTYWDRLGWKDPFSLPAATERQRRYSAQLGQDGVYTPQMVVGGRHQAVGSDRPAVLAALAQGRSALARSALAQSDEPAVPLSVVPDPAGLRVQAGSGAGTATVWLVGFDPQRTTPVRAGENGGRTLTEINVVRSFAAMGEWRGAALSLAVPRPAGERAAVLLQAADGRILAAAILP